MMMNTSKGLKVRHYLKCILCIVFTLLNTSGIIYAQFQLDELSPYVSTGMPEFKAAYEQIYQSNLELQKSLEDVNPLNPDNQKQRQLDLIGNIPTVFKTVNAKLSAEKLESDQKLIKTVLIVAKLYYAQNKIAGSEEFYLNHVLEAANNLTQYQGSAEAICAMLLHRMDVLEIKNYLKQKIAANKINEIVNLKKHFSSIADDFPYNANELEGQHKIQNFMNAVFKKTQRNPQIMRMLFADRMASVKIPSKIKKQKRTEEIEDIYARAAARMGDTGLYHDFRNELFKLNEPEKYNFVMRKIKDSFNRDYKFLKRELETEVKMLERLLPIYIKSQEEKLAGQKQYTLKVKKVDGQIVIENADGKIINVQFMYRVKKPYEIYGKEEKLSAALDIMGIRIVCDCNENELYQFVSFIQEKYIDIKFDRFEEKFYKAERSPDSPRRLGGVYFNFRRTAHSPPYEIQLLTKEFHEQREREDPHWVYKLKRYKNQLFDAEVFLPTGDFDQDFYRVYDSLDDYVFVIERRVQNDSGKVELRTVRLPKGPQGVTTLVMAAHSSTDEYPHRLADYAGATFYKWNDQGKLVEDKTRSVPQNQIIDGDIVTINRRENALFNNLRDDKYRYMVEQSVKYFPRAHVKIAMLTLSEKMKYKNIALGKDYIRDSFSQKGIKIKIDNEFEKILESIAKSKKFLNKQELYLSIVLRDFKAEEIVDLYTNGFEQLNQQLRLEDKAVIEQIEKNYGSFTALCLKVGLGQKRAKNIFKALKQKISSELKTDDVRKNKMVINFSKKEIGINIVYRFKKLEAVTFRDLQIDEKNRRITSNIEFKPQLLNEQQIIRALGLSSNNVSFEIFDFQSGIFRNSPDVLDVTKSINSAI